MSETPPIAPPTDDAAFTEEKVRAERLATNLNPARQRMAYVTLSVLVGSLAGLIGVEVMWDIPDMVLGLAVSIIGMLAGQFQQMIGFFFGTSSGSAARAAEIGRIAEKR